MQSIRKILRETFILDETILDKNVLKAIMMAGAAGSGKSYITSLITQNVHPAPKIIDSDKIFEAKLKSANLPAKLSAVNSPERDKQMEKREEAIIANVKVLNSLLNGFMPLIIDGTGKNYNKFIERKKALESMGYDVLCLMVNTSLEVAQERNAKRPRSLTPEEVESFWKTCQANFQRYPHDFRFHLTVNNDPGQLDNNRLIRVIDKFFSSPLQNPLGQELYKNKDKGPISRSLKPIELAPFH